VADFISTVAMSSAKEAESRCMKRYWEVIADNLSEAGWSWGCQISLGFQRANDWIVDAHRGDGKRFVVRADEMLTAFVELELPVRAVVGGESRKVSLRLSGDA
jgi:hypothetical protein